MIEIPTIFPKPGGPIVKLTTTARETYYATGTEVRRTDRGTELHVRRCGALGYTRSFAPIAAVELLTEDAYLGLFEVGTRVFVPKYGDTYSGRVVEVGRKRLVVSFITRGGKSKTMSFALRDVGITR